MNRITIQSKVHFCRGRRSKKELRQGDDKVPPVRGVVPRVSRLMALAIRFDHLIRDGVVADQSELAPPGHVTQPRMTQIMNLNYLAPDIQEEILFLPRVTSGRDPIHERMLRPLTVQADWRKQRQMWHSLRARLLGEGGNHKGDAGQALRRDPER